MRAIRAQTEAVARSAWQTNINQAMGMIHAHHARQTLSLQLAALLTLPVSVMQDIQAQTGAIARSA